MPANRRQPRERLEPGHLSHDRQRAQADGGGGAGRSVGSRNEIAILKNCRIRAAPWAAVRPGLLPVSSDAASVPTGESGSGRLHPDGVIGGNRGDFPSWSAGKSVNARRGLVGSCGSPTRHGSRLSSRRRFAWGDAVRFCSAHPAAESAHRRQRRTQSGRREQRNDGPAGAKARGGRRRRLRFREAGGTG
jgi:hypothetical protein